MMMLLQAHVRDVRNETNAADPLGQCAVEIRDERLCNRIVIAYDLAIFTRSGENLLLSPPLAPMP
ncbi:hypothetical protein GGR40_003960 [Novosphingobium gossypii]